MPTNDERGYGTASCERCKRPFTRRSSSHTYCDDCQPPHQAERKAAWRSKQRTCVICSRPYLPKSTAAKICHDPACKREGKRRSEAKYKKARAQQ